MGRNKKLPARTIEGRENQLIALAVDAAEEKLLNGTASSQIIALLLKLGTSRAQLEMEKIRSELELSRAKVRQIDQQGELQQKYEEAIAAMKLYGGDDMGEEVYDDWNN